MQSSYSCRRTYQQEPLLNIALPVTVRPLAAVGLLLLGVNVQPWNPGLALPSNPQGLDSEEIHAKLVPEHPGKHCLGWSHPWHPWERGHDHVDMLGWPFRCNGGDPTGQCNNGQCNNGKNNNNNMTKQAGPGAAPEEPGTVSDVQPVALKDMSLQSLYPIQPAPPGAANLSAPAAISVTTSVHAVK
jgi:hypothetical protein